MELPDSDWATDERLFASLPGGQAVIDWFGFCPSFHDGTLEQLELSCGNGALAVKTWKMGPSTDAEGYFLVERLALMTLRLNGVSGAKLEEDAGSVISELMIRRVQVDTPHTDWETCTGPISGDIEIAFDTAVGLHGTLYARDLSLELQPLSDITAA